MQVYVYQEYAIKCIGSRNSVKISFVEVWRFGEVKSDCSKITILVIALKESLPTEHLLSPLGNLVDPKLG